MSNIIDALKRLERAGDENSRSTKKLVEAAVTLADAIEPKCPAYVELPRGYEVVRLGTQDGGYSRYLAKMGAHHHEVGNAVFGRAENDTDGYDYFAPASRIDALTLAKDIAEGWLVELAEFLEARAAENGAATEKIESAKI